MTKVTQRFNPPVQIQPDRAVEKSLTPTTNKTNKKVLVCSSYESFYDLCENNLVKGHSVHCVFRTRIDELVQFERMLAKKGGTGITVSPTLLNNL